MPFVDVRGVAGLPLLAMTLPEADGERFLASSDASLSVWQIWQILHARHGLLAAKAPWREIPTWLSRAMALSSPSVPPLRLQLDRTFAASSENARFGPFPAVSAR